MYATRQDLETRFGTTEVTKLDVDGAVDTALVDGFDLANSYIGCSYVLPLTTTPQVLTQMVCDVVRFKLYRLNPPEQVKVRHDAAIKWLEQVAKGVTVLPPQAGVPLQSGGTHTPATPATAEGRSSGVFSDAAMADMPQVYPVGLYHNPNTGKFW